MLRAGLRFVESTSSCIARRADSTRLDSTREVKSGCEEMRVDVSECVRDSRVTGCTSKARVKHPTKKWEKGVRSSAMKGISINWMKVDGNGQAFFAALRKARMFHVHVATSLECDWPPRHAATRQRSLVKPSEATRRAC